MRIVGTPVASGPITGHETRYYRYGGDKPYTGGPPSSPNTGAQTRTANREARKNQFKAALAGLGYRLSDDISPSVRDKAGLKVGVTAKIARHYLAELRALCAAGHDWQPDGDDPEAERPMRCYTCGTTETEAASA